MTAFMIAVQTSSAAVINPFSGNLSDYTSTVINNNGDGAYTSVWSLDGSNHLSLTTTGATNIDQFAFIQNGLSLSVGDEIKVSFSVTGSQDFGLYVGGTTPVTNTRQNYVNVYVRPSSGEIYTRGFDGTSEYAFARVTASYDSLFIARTATNTYELGYYSGVTRNILATRTPTTANSGSVVGFYADVRAAGTLGYATVVPEPHEYGLAIVGLLGGVVLFRRLRIQSV